MAVTQDGLTPLHSAVSTQSVDSRYDVVKVLLKSGAMASVQDNDGRTPLDWLEDEFSPSIVRALLKSMEYSREMYREELRTAD